MNNAFRRTPAFFILCLLSLPLFSQGDGGGYMARPNYFDGFNSFYMHPMNSYFSGSMFSAGHDISYSSNAAVNNLAYDFYLKNPISGEAVRKSVSKLSEINIAGQEVNTGFQYLFPKKKSPNQFFFVGYNYRRHQSVRFSGEFGQFFFQGNKPFAGKEIYADDLHYLSTRYDDLQFGWLKYFNWKGKRAIFSVSGGVARGYNHHSIDVTRGRLFTEENGDYVTLRLDMQSRRTYYSPYLTQSSGIGGMAEAKLNLLLTDKSAIGIELTDFGVIRWDNRSAIYNRGDTTIRFDGVFIASPDSINNPDYMQQLGDTIVNRFKIPNTNGSFTSFMPAKIGVTYYMGFTDKNFVNVKLRMMAFTTFRPQLMIESLNFINRRFYSVTGISLGGFGPFDIYQQVGFQFNKKYFFGLGLFGIEGMIMPSQTAGFGGNANFAARF